MATSNGGYLHANNNPPVPAPTLLPPWLSNSNENPSLRPPSPSVTLSLSPSTVAATPIPWLQPHASSLTLANSLSRGPGPVSGENALFSELVECSRELEEVQRAMAAHRKEAAWGMRRAEMQLESERARRRREKVEEIEAKINALREEQKVSLERIEAEYREQLAGLRRDAEAKEQKLADQWAAKHVRLSKFVEQIGYRPRAAEPSGR
ncbi:hypothetical protein BT93_L3602 [Corymbia citriodora subsp. variegata]|uniref:Uncharacterized protein n=1 Tax=Corymbia citriodora subsp. variegata TaxID=360336 RepID=A0A8T0CH64_CORYI|nr:hypothetical protein BT93_L3602 [Corymbia citriodora subsp. variegata]